MDTLRIDDKGGYCWRKRILRGRALCDSRPSSTRQDRGRHIAQDAGKRVADVLVNFAGAPGIGELQFSESTLENLLGSGAEFFF